MRIIYTILSVIMLVAPVYSAEPIVNNDISGLFNIEKVNRIEKLWAIPTYMRDFMGNRRILEYDYARKLPSEKQGEDYIITWSYKGKEPADEVTVSFECVYEGNKMAQPIVEKNVLSGVKRGTYNWTFENVGNNYTEKGKVDRWRVTIVCNGRTAVEKRSASWTAMVVKEAVINESAE